MAIDPGGILGGSWGEPPKCRMGEPVPPCHPIRFLNPACKNPSSAAWLGNKRSPVRLLFGARVQLCHFDPIQRTCEDKEGGGG